MDQPAAIRTEGLHKALGRSAVLRGVDLAVRAGECVALRGDNGAGKTTLLRCLAGLLRPDAGLVVWFDRSPREPAARRLLGMVAHEGHLYPHLTLLENLVLVARLQDVPGAVAAARRGLDAAGLGPHADRLPREVSKGMRQRAALARALVHETPILLLDEPFAGLDPSGRAWLSDLLGARRERGWATCFVSHDDATTRALADRVLELRAGRLRESVASRARPAEVAA